MKSFSSFTNIIAEEERTKVTQRGLQWQIPVEPQSTTPQPTKTTKKPKVVKQSEVSAANIQQNVQRALDKKREEAVKRGYIDPVTGRVQERGVVTNRIRAGSLGYGDPGNDPLKYGINPADVAKEKGSLFQRAVSTSRPERRAARSEIRRGIRSIQTRYPVSGQNTATSFRGFSRGIGFKPSPTDISTLHRMARPETSPQSAASLSSQLGVGSGRRAQAASDAARDIMAEPQRQAQQAAQRSATQSAALANLQQAINKPEVKPVQQPKPLTASQVKPLQSAPKPSPVSAAALTPPKPKVVTPAPAPAPKPETINLGRVNREPLKIQKPSPVQVTTVANKPISSSEKIANAVVKASNQVRADIAAEKAAETAKTIKRMGRLGALTTGIGAAVDAATVYTQKRGEGYSKPRALGAGLSQAGGGLAGAATGARIGGAIAGLPGAVVGGIGGYTVGSGAGKEIFKAVTGDPSTKLTTQGVLTNIRKSVPQNIRAQVPANVRKGFTDFVKASGRAYGNWRRSQEGKDGK